MSTTKEQVLKLGRRWTQAEQRGDHAELGELATEDFTLVGPLGFVLTRTQWLDRFRGGDLVVHALEWADVTVRDYGSAVVAVGVVSQRAAYQGHPTDGRFRVTQIAVRGGDRWLLAGLHYSPIGAPPPFAADTARREQGEAR